MSDVGDEDRPAATATLAEFFAETDRPAAKQSSFTPEDVAELVRQDRDASS